MNFAEKKVVKLFFWCIYRSFISLHHQYTKKTMNIKNLLEEGSATMLVVTPTALREFAVSVVEEMSRVQEEPKFTAAEFAKRHKVDKSTIYRWCKAGILRPLVIGGKKYYRDSDFVGT